MVNENKEQLLADLEVFFLQLVPSQHPWPLTDLHLRTNIPPTNRPMPTAS